MESSWIVFHKIISWEYKIELIVVFFFKLYFDFLSFFILFFILFTFFFIQIFSKILSLYSKVMMIFFSFESREWKVHQSLLWNNLNNIRTMCCSLLYVFVRKNTSCRYGYIYTLLFLHIRVCCSRNNHLDNNIPRYIHDFNRKIEII